MRLVSMASVVTVVAGPAIGQCGGWHPGDGVPGIVGGPWLQTYASVIEPWDPDGTGPMPERLVIAGNYRAIASLVTSAPVSWDGQEWYEHPGIDARVVKGFASVNGTLYAYGSTIHRWNGIGWDEMPGVMSNPAGLAGFRGQLYATGVFASPSGPIAGLIRLNDEGWERVGFGANSRLYAFDDKLVVLNTGNWLGDRWGSPLGSNTVLAPYGDLNISSQSEFVGSGHYIMWFTASGENGTFRMGGSFGNGGHGGPPHLSFSVNDRVHGLMIGVNGSLYRWNGLDWEFFRNVYVSDYIGSDEYGFLASFRSLGNQGIVSGNMRKLYANYYNRIGVANAARLRDTGMFEPLYDRGLDAPVILGKVRGKIVAVGALDVADLYGTVGAAERRSGAWHPIPIPTFDYEFRHFRSAGDVMVTGVYGNRYQVFSYDGTGWTAAPECFNESSTFALWNGRLYATGNAFQPGPILYTEYGVCRLAAQGGPHMVSALALHENALHYLDDVSTIGRLGPNGAITLGTLAVDSGRAISIDSSSQGLLLSGSFRATDSDLLPIRGIALWDGTGFRALGDGLEGEVEQAIEYDGNIFASVRGVGIFRWDGVSWTPLGGGISGSMAVADGLLHVGGFFLSREGGGSAYYATWSSGGEPILLDTPADLSRCRGNVAVFRVRADGPGLRYSWRRDGVPIADGATPSNSFVSGTNTPRLIVERLSGDDEGLYTCEVSNGCGSIETPAARITVCVADISCDNAVDMVDFFMFLHSYDTGKPMADINADGSVDLVDFFAFFEGWNRQC